MILMKIALTLQISLGSVSLVKILILSTCRHEISFYLYLGCFYCPRLLHFWLSLFLSILFSFCLCTLFIFFCSNPPKRSKGFFHSCWSIGVYSLYTRQGYIRIFSYQYRVYFEHIFICTFITSLSQLLTLFSPSCRCVYSKYTNGTCCRILGCVIWMCVWKWGTSTKPTISD